MSKLDVVMELHKPARRNYTRRCVTIKGLNDLWQADLVEMIPFAKQNNNVRYILTVINTFSKFGFAEPVKNKTGLEVSRAFEKILKSTTPPRKLQTDMGKEFYNKNFETLLKQYGIHHYSTYSNLKASIVERFNRTLKSRMWRQFSLQGSHKWINILQDLVSQYNRTKHSTIKMCPINVDEKKEKNLLSTVYSTSVNNIPKKYKFEIGDPVRVSKNKGVFDKSYTPNWSTEIFRINCIQMTKPVTYLLEDYKGEKIIGSFYGEELLKTRFPDIYLVEKIMKVKNDKVLVKWLGFPESTWINKKDIL